MPDLRSLLVDQGPSSAAELRAQLRVTASTLQRSIARERASVLVVGRARATRYAVRRAINGLLTPLRVHQITPEGDVRLALTLHPVEPTGFYVEPHVDTVESGFHGTRRQPIGLDTHSELPWFLQDLKPSGFLGRAWLRAHLDRGFPADLVRWTADDVLRYAAHFGTDLLGSWVVGDFALELIDRLPPPPRIAPELLPEFAERALTEAPFGSSVAGEQPKFLGRRGETPCLIKFSPPVDTRAGRRWADLLLVEHLVHTVLQECGVEACRSEVIDAGPRRFLVVDRFDRVGHTGRRGVASLGTLDSQGIAGELRSWSVATSALLREGRVAPTVHARVQWLEAFGHLIANTDMHTGNLAFRLDGSRIQDLAPVYDMLPMFFSPRFGGEIRDGLYAPTAHRSDFPASARLAARELWARVQVDDRISSDFRTLAAAQQRLA